MNAKHDTDGWDLWVLNPDGTMRWVNGWSARARTAAEVWASFQTDGVSRLAHQQDGAQLILTGRSTKQIETRFVKHVPTVVYA